MIVLAILATLGSIGWTFIAVLANGMSDTPGRGFQGGWTIFAVWLVTAILWLAWGVG